MADRPTSQCSFSLLDPGTEKALVTHSLLQFLPVATEAYMSPASRVPWFSLASWLAQPGRRGDCYMKACLSHDGDFLACLQTLLPRNSVELSLSPLLLH